MVALCRSGWMFTGCMISQLFNLIILLAVGVILVFVGGVWLHFSMKKGNEKQREAALKKQTSEPSQSDY